MKRKNDVHSETVPMPDDEKKSNKSQKSRTNTLHKTKEPQNRHPACEPEKLNFLHECDNLKIQFVREEGKTHKTLLENAPIAFFQGDYQGSILTINNKAEELSGYSAIELLQMNLAQLFPVKIPVDISLKSDQQFVSIATKCESKFVNKTGQHFPVEIYSNNLEDGTFLYLISDISERRTAEDGLIELIQKLEGMNQIKSQFIYTVSHEFKTHLAGIHSCAQLLKLYGNLLEDNKKEQIYRQIFEALQHTLDLIDHIKLNDQNEENILACQPSMVAIKPFFQKIIQENIFPARLDFKIDLDCNLKKDKYLIDAFMLRHIFGNLLSNAMKFSGRNKYVKIEITELKDQKLKFEVIDHGIGIPKNEVEKVFTPFFRASNATESGKGLGMAIMKRFVSLHNGEVFIESEVGVGTKVTVVVPFNL